MARNGVLFDVDGTLVDSNYLHVAAWLAAFRRNGFDDVTGADVHRGVGMGAGLLLDTLLGEDVDQESLKDAHAEAYRAQWPYLRPFPGAVDLVREVRRRGGESVLATSATEEEVEALRRTLDCDDAISHVTSSADVEEAKPSPDIFRTAIEKTGLDPANVVVVGDTRWDVEAASRAGLPCVAVLTGGLPEEVLREAGAKEVYADAAALLAAFDQSLLGSLLPA
ncbi:MAG TPA: HAD family hydrolase [Frankiaceae bacterium]|nr:HAD family hydrolase [Frankiaceae bacterium]